MSLRIDITGMRSGRLVTVRFAGRDDYSQAMWLCHCDCGNKNVIVRGYLIRNKITRSCGCLRREVVALRHRIHGHAASHDQTKQRSLAYKSWLSMKSRCLISSATGWERYGGANPPVLVCKRWLHSFENFLADMGPRPKGTSLGRFMDIGDYCPGNCKWMTASEQRIEQWKKIKAAKKGVAA